MRIRWVVPALAMLTALGCSGRSSMLTGGPSTGQLKASLSHYQYENEQLKTEVAKLRSESRSFEDRLVQEQIHNGDLTARLDDARNLLRDRGLVAGAGLGTSREGDDDSGEETRPAGPRALPARRSSRRARKPPAAQIRGDGDGPTDASASSFGADGLRWQPVARGSEAENSERK